MSIRLSTLLYLDTDDTEKIQKCIQSIQLERSDTFPAVHQLLLLDPKGESNAALRFASGRPGCEVQTVDVAGLEIGAAYNRGLAKARGYFISFMLASSFLSPGAYDALFRSKEAETEPLLGICPKYGGSGLNPEEYPMKPDTSGPKDACMNPDDVLAVLQAFLIRREFLADMRFREDLHEEASMEMILRLLDKNSGRFFYNAGLTYFFQEPLENMRDLTNLSVKRWWYEDSVTRFLTVFLEETAAKHQGAVPGYLQRVVFYLMCCKYKCNLSGRDKFMLDASEYAVFFDQCCRLLIRIDNDVISNFDPPVWKTLPRLLRMQMLKRKASLTGHTTALRDKDGVIQCLFLNADKDLENPESCTDIGDLNQTALDIKVINYKKGRLEIDGFFEGASFLDDEPFEVFGALTQGGKMIRKFPAARTDVYDLLRCFGVTYGRKYGIHLEIPVELLCDTGNELSFFVKYRGVQFRLLLGFSTINSRLLWYSQKSYWRFADGRYMLTRKDRSLYVTKSTKGKLFRQEAMFLAVLALQKNHREALTCAAVRLLYWLMRPVYGKKRIWVTFDKLYKAGDNGEYMFRYCQTQNDGIDCYYVINKDAGDFRKLKKEYPGRILCANSWKSRLICLQAEAILATHAGTATYLGLGGSLQKYFKNLFQADNICIQHGLSMQDISSFQNRLYANTRLYCCASPFEIRNIERPVYGYLPEMLKMTGLARYDGLKSRERRQILITPTWRKNIVQVKGVGMHNDHSNTFRETTYFRVYNSLINDPRLISCAKEHDCRIVFLLHPAMSAQIGDYDRNDYVELLQATGDMNYEQILTESSLMVTDYSGVQYDFAYQRKPLVYYHPAELPPHYHDSGLDYETMGFGPICTSHAQLIECLCGYIRNGFRTEETYKKRADEFFAFSDFDNCGRIYQEVLEFEKEMHA